MQEASKIQLESIAVPAISAGIFGGTLENAGEMLVQGALDFLVQNPLSSVKHIKFVLFKSTDFAPFMDGSQSAQLPTKNSWPMAELLLKTMNGSDIDARKVHPMVQHVMTLVNRDHIGLFACRIGRPEKRMETSTQAIHKLWFQNE